jgi:hypothetical protein
VPSVRCIISSNSSVDRTAVSLSSGHQAGDDAELFGARILTRALVVLRAHRKTSLRSCLEPEVRPRVEGDGISELEHRREDNNGEFHYPAGWVSPSALCVQRLAHLFG